MGRQQKYPRVYPHASCTGIPLGQYNSSKLLYVTSNVNYVYMGGVVGVALIVVVIHCIAVAFAMHVSLPSSLSWW